MKKEVNEARIGSEYRLTYHRGGGAPCTLASGNKRLKNRNVYTFDKDRKLMKQAIMDMDILVDPGIEIRAFLDSFTAYAHHFLSEVGFAKWSTATVTIRWKLSELLDENTIVRDWTGRHFEKQVFTDSKNIPVRELVHIGFLLL